MSDQKSITPIYSVVQSLCLMSFCIAVSFAAVYLQKLGYSNSHVGVILAIGNLVGTFLGIILSSFIDKYKFLDSFVIIPRILYSQAISLVSLSFFSYKNFLTSICFSAFIALCLVNNPLLLQVYVDFLREGFNIDFGISRGTASFCYVLISVVTGVLLKKISVRTLPLLGLTLCTLQILCHFILCQHHKNTKNEPNDYTGSGLSIPSFAKSNKQFCVLLFGIALIYFGHNIVCNFLINVVRNVGGDEETMGYLNGFMATMEIPVMFFFSQIKKNKKIISLLKLSVVCFALKGFAIAIAYNLPMLFASFILQAPSFALYTSAVVDFVNENLPYKDSAKAQSLAYGMTTLGAVLASVCGGYFYDVTTVSKTVWIASGICFLGTIVALAGLQRFSKMIQKTQKIT